MKSQWWYAAYIIIFYKYTEVPNAFENWMNLSHAITANWMKEERRRRRGWEWN